MEVTEYHKKRMKIVSGDSHSAFEQACFVILIALVGVFYHEWVLSSWLTQAAYTLAILIAWYLVTRYQNWSKNQELKAAGKYHKYDLESGNFQN